VHFIFKHKNPVTDAVEEKHVSSPPSAVTALQTTLYTIVRRPPRPHPLVICTSRCDEFDGSGGRWFQA